MIKGYVNNVEKSISRVAMIVNGQDKGWEVRAKDGTLIWGADKTLTGVSSINFKGYGVPLTNYSIGSGLTTQSGTPSPSNIIQPTMCGNLVSSGEHSGQFEVPITCGNTTYSAYLTEQLRKIGDNVDYLNGNNTVVRNTVDIQLDQLNWSYVVSSDLFYAVCPEDITQYSFGYCNGYTVSQAASIAGQPDFSIRVYSSGSQLRFSVKHYSLEGDTTAFNNFLTQNNVHAWFPINTPTVETITSPIITPTTGNTSISIGTSLLPSSLSITGHIKPTT